jgi:hypothetical protein
MRLIDKFDFSRSQVSCSGRNVEVFELNAGLDHLVQSGRSY